MAATTKRRRESGFGSDEVDRLYAWGGVALVGLLVAVLGFMLDVANIDVWTAVLTAVVLVAVSVPLFRWISSADDWPRLHRWLLAALVLKLLVSLVRYWFIFRLNGGNGDAGVYIEAAGEFAQRVRLGLPLHPLGRIANFPKESQYIGDITGVVFYITGASRYSAFFVFTWFCYLGQVLSVRALRVAVPEADHRRYMLAMLFLPSLLFWPSSVGKEAVMIFSLGVVSYGAALLLAPRPRLRGIVYFAAGFGAIVLVRPHIALMALVSLVGALGMAFVAGRGGDAVPAGGHRRSGTSRPSGGQGRAVRFLAIIGLVAVTVLALGQLSSTLDGGKDGQEATAQEQLSKAARQTSIGNSAFTPVQATSVVDLPAAVGTVVFRPFLWEGGAGGAVAAVESALLLLLTLLSLPRLATFPALALRRTYLLFSSAFVIVFAFGFSYIGNFGILARQRVQMFPALLVLMALPTRAALAERWRGRTDGAAGGRSGGEAELPEPELGARAGTLVPPRSTLRWAGSRVRP